MSFRAAKVQGLDDGQLQTLLDSLRALAAELGSEAEPVVFAVAEAAKEFLSDHNAPPSDCCVCMQSLAGPPTAEDGGVLKLHCFHCYHEMCFGRWWLSLVDKAAARQANSPHGPRIVAEAVCPVCRAPVDAATLKLVEPAIGPPAMHPLLAHGMIPASAAAAAWTAVAEMCCLLLLLLLFRSCLGAPAGA